MGDPALSISIVIPTLNAGRAFGTILHRIMGQGQVPVEIVCADLGSTDGTRHIVSQFPLARFVEITEPPGPKSWNRAMEAARGDVVVFLAQNAVPGNGDWLTHLTAPFVDPSVGGVYGRQEASLESDPLSGFRLGQRFCREAHWRRIRVGDAVRYASLPFFIDNAAVRRSVWRGIHFNEHLPVGADRFWARQVVLASCTIAYAPDALIIRHLHPDLKATYHLAVLTGYTDEHFRDAGGTFWPDSRRLTKRAVWYLFRGLAWGRLPYLAIEDAVQRYGYKLGRRLDRLGPGLRERIAPETKAEELPGEISDLAA
ncbi:MAG: glycosyltransferase family 2 protein [Chloroflexi bacterium]|nr:MAG: glycosyltransferase family 2 protein [Chloroflexota bacterium]